VKKHQGKYLVVMMALLVVPILYSVHPADSVMNAVLNDFGRYEVEASQLQPENSYEVLRIRDRIRGQPL
jgi:hypothetical protein